MDNTETMEVPHVRPEESANSEQTEIFDVGKTKDSVVESNTKESELGDVETTTLSGTSQKEPCEEVLDSKNQEDLSNGKGNSVLTETTNPPVNDNSSESREFEDGEGNVTDSEVDNQERSQEGEGQDPGTCDDAGAQSKDKTLKITETLENNRENVSNLDRQAKGESAPSSPVECYTSESSLYSDSDGENAGSLKKESKLLSRGSVQGASASEELLECDMTNTEKQRVSLDETLESVKDGLNHSEASQKDLSGDKVVHCNNTEEMSTKRDDDTGVPIPDISVITDSKEGSKGNVEESKEQDVETTTKGEPALASVEMTTCPEASQKNPSGDEVVECNDLENLSTDKCGTGVPTAMPPNMSSIPPQAGVITISKEDNKGNFKKSNVHDKETATKEEPALASVEMTTCPEASQKNPSGDEVVECNDLENLSTDKCGTGVPTAMPPNMSSIPPQAGVITISKEDKKGNFEKSNVHDKETATKEEPAFASVEMTTCPEASQKNPSGDEVVECNDLENLSTDKCGTGVPTAMPPNMSSIPPQAGVITISKEDNKGNFEKSNVHDKETATKEEPVLASVEMTTCPEASQKNPSGDEVVECNDLENLSTDKCGTGVPTAMPPNMSSVPPEAGDITISKEDKKGNFEKSNVHDKETATKEVAEKSEVTNEVTTTSTTETDPHGAITVMNNLDEQIILPPEKEKSVRQIESTNSNGLSPVESKSELNSFDGDKSPEAFIQSQIPETIIEGTSSTINSKDSEMLPAGFGNVKTQLKVSEDSEESCPVEKTSESDVNKGIVSEEEESASVGSQEFNLLSSILSSDHGESESTGQGIIRISNASIEEIGSALGQIFQMIASREGGASSGASSDEEDQISWRPEPYCKAGYSVVISNSKLCESTEEKAVVTMESGTEFFISIGNNNDRAAEVDITFGGIYLGVWLVEAKQSLSNPLIIEGCTWAAGRFKFFSASDKKKLQPNADIYGERAEVDGLIELKFKPEADTMKMFVHHVREQGSYRLVPVTVADPRTATIADLKQEIKGSWGSSISCLLKGGQVLQEEETISSYDLGENEVIEVVNATEELTIEAVGRDPITLMVDPKNISVKALKEFITARFKIPVDQQLLQFKEQDGVVDSKSITHMLLTSKKKPVLVVSREEPGGEDSRGLDTSARSCEDQGSRAEDSCKLNEESNDSGDNDQNGVAILYGNKESVYKQFREDAMDRKFSRKKAVTLFIQLKDKSKKAANAKTKPEPKPFEQPGTSSSRPKGCMSSLYPPETPD